jgi:hypothetical protein
MSNEEARIEKSGEHFVHYTNAAVAFSILKNREIWMRNAGAMNDHSEIQHGEVCLNHALNGEQGTRFNSMLNSIYPGMVDNIESNHRQLQNYIRENTFLTCVSEHKETENLTGRLSMWRAYGGDNGVALVINRGALLNQKRVTSMYTRVL